MLLFSDLPHTSVTQHFNKFAKNIGCLAGVALLATILSCPVSVSAQSVGASGLPLPRFVSLKAKRVNMRVGPGRDYQVQWLYLKKNLPMEIIQEYGNWRKVRDPKGDEGWILHSLLSGKRVAIVRPWDMPEKPVADGISQKTAGRIEARLPVPTINLYASSSNSANVVAQLEAGSIGQVEQCENEWCRLSIENIDHTITGYVEQTQIWGVYPDEQIDD